MDNFKRVETSLGREIWFEDHQRRILIFWGNRSASEAAVRDAYPHLRLILNRQVHGAQIQSVNQSTLTSDRIEADGLTTVESGLALGVITADCLPILMFSVQSPNLFALHAGWRGVEKRIFPKALEQIQKISSALSWQVLIGPHIQEASFEIGGDVFEQLVLSQNSLARPADRQTFAAGDKVHLDLSNIVRQQGDEFPELDLSYNLSEQDTCRDLSFHSFRRDREQAGRQIHFIAQF